MAAAAGGLWPVAERAGANACDSVGTDLAALRLEAIS
jgi:hypothetical protein